MYYEYQETLIEKLRMVQFTTKDNQVLGFEAGMDCLVSMFLNIKSSKKSVFFIGNGGSSAIASHMTADFMKNGGIRTASLYNSAVTTCLSNDYGYRYVFSKQLEYLTQDGDMLVAVSSSGKSENIIIAACTAASLNACIVTFTGFLEDNRLRSMGDLNVYVPVGHYGIVESVHNLILQQAVDVILERDGIPGQYTGEV